ncbi:hypothetical protein E1301_Tti003938 [Triplophysa tibetana]|uniref:Uncharacterized protein n=1 Tax=Triplophysa tibetana TaxID=1572043 RepID=A0A5A9NN60_9TELE|nr:hypothetical protein E1301_Tti003938 [Triplophysa tibetana]
MTYESSRGMRTYMEYFLECISLPNRVSYICMHAYADTEAPSGHREASGRSRPPFPVPLNRFQTVKDVHFKAAFTTSDPVTLVIIIDRCSDRKCLISPNKCLAMDVSLHNRIHINCVKLCELRLRYILT